MMMCHCCKRLLPKSEKRIEVMSGGGVELFCRKCAELASRRRMAREKRERERRPAS